jgi:hypothetical protein
MDLPGQTDEAIEGLRDLVKNLKARCWQRGLSDDIGQAGGTCAKPNPQLAN